jgi:uncharacterized low-complexity protein
MSKLSTLTPIAAVLAVAVAGFSHAAENPFAVKPVAGIVLADAGKEGHCGGAKEGKCGAAKEGKCGGDKMKEEGKAAIHDGKAMKEGKCGKGKAKKEGKCGEGKCGAKKKAVDEAAAAKAAAEKVAPVVVPAAK